MVSSPPQRCLSTFNSVVGRSWYVPFYWLVNNAPSFKRINHADPFTKMSGVKLIVSSNVRSPSSRLTKSPERIHSNDGNFVYGQCVIRQDLSGQEVEELKQAVRMALLPQVPIPNKVTRTIIIRSSVNTNNANDGPKPANGSILPKPTSGGTAVRRHSRSKDCDGASSLRTIPVHFPSRHSQIATGVIFSDSRRQRIGGIPSDPSHARVVTGLGKGI